MEFKIQNDSLILLDEHNHEYQVTIDDHGYLEIDVVSDDHLVIHPQSETSIILSGSDEEL